MPPNGPATSVADPYADVHTSLIEPIPKPGEPGDGSTTSLTIHVPAEDTTIDMGAGQLPGIRMETAHHIHMTAKAPLTTISLGGQGGEESECAGISMYTAGDEKIHVLLTKEEHIVGKVEIKYDADSDETVGGKLDKHVVGKADYKYDTSLETTIGAGGWEAKVHGKLDWTIDQNVEIKAMAAHNVFVQGSKAETIVGITEELKIGGENTQIIGEKTEIIVGGELKTNIGGVLEIAIGPSAEITGPLKSLIHPTLMEVNGMDKKVEGLEDATKALHTLTTAVMKDTMGLDISTKNIKFQNASAEIKSAALTLLK